ncbi:MAG: hypothetical protein QXG25_06785, partial [Nitrososphaerota archaeon]
RMIAIALTSMTMKVLLFDNSPSNFHKFTTCIRDYLVDIVRRLKVRNIWQYLDPPVRGWLDLACKLKGIKFKSREVLLVLCRILSRIKPLLDFPGLMAAIGARYAWKSSQLAANWGNKNAESWRNDKAFSFYCGLISLQVSRILPGMISPELHFLQDVVRGRGFKRILGLFRKIL